jgi:type VI secretion system protein ImpK
LAGKKMQLSDCFMELMAYTTYLCQGRMNNPPPYEETRRRYDDLLQQAGQCCQDAGFDEDDRQMALFAVCAWIDETILCSEWPERGRWQEDQLQRLHFQTMNAGEEFFARLAELDPEATAIREVYAYCLALGFKGRYFLPEDDKKLVEIQKANLLLVKDNLDMSVTEKLFPDGYSGVPVEVKRKRWLRGLSIYTIIVMAISLLGVIALFSVYKALLSSISQSSFGPGF